jgi:hypothetical protein
MLNNKNAWHICGKGLDDYFKYAFSYEVCANVLEIFKYGGEFVGISYSSKYYKYCKGLPKGYAVILYSLWSAMPGPNNDFVIKK